MQTAKKQYVVVTTQTIQMHNFTANYEKILKVLYSFSEEKLLPYQRRNPKLKDIEVISLCLTAEYMSIDSENHLFRLLPEFLKAKIELSVYNRRKRRLFPYLEAIRRSYRIVLMNLKTVLLSIVCLWKYVNYPEVQEAKSVKKHPLVLPIDDIVQLNQSTIMAINYMLYVR